MYDFDWFHGQPLFDQMEQAKLSCAFKKYPDQNPNEEPPEEFSRFKDELEVRILLYLRDGFSYELKQLVELGPKANLTFECEPADEQYKVGSFVVSVPYEEVVRVEVFAVHPSERPADSPVITGFHNAPEQPPGPQPREDRPGKVRVTSDDPC